MCSGVEGIHLKSSLLPFGSQSPQQNLALHLAITTKIQQLVKEAHHSQKNAPIFETTNFRKKQAGKTINFRDLEIKD